MYRRTPSTLVQKFVHNGSSYAARDHQFPNVLGQERFRQTMFSRTRHEPRAHKMPHEYDLPYCRYGSDWALRYRQQGRFSNWPWVTWRHDPVRNHKPEYGPSRTISAQAENPALGMPLWNHYEDAAQDYQLPNDAPIHLMIPILNVYVGRVWGPERIKGYFDLLREEGWECIDEVNASIDHIREWNETFYKVPPGLIEHIALLSEDIVKLNAKKTFRRKLHNEKAVLRTGDMERYYSMPYYTGPAMPEERKQAQEYDDGEFTNLDRPAIAKVHPVIPLDHSTRKHPY